MPNVEDQLVYRLRVAIENKRIPIGGLVYGLIDLLIRRASGERVAWQFYSSAAAAGVVSPMPWVSTFHELCTWLYLNCERRLYNMLLQFLPLPWFSTIDKSLPATSHAAGPRLANVVAFHRSLASSSPMAPRVVTQTSSVALVNMSADDVSVATGLSLTQGKRFVVGGAGAQCCLPANDETRLLLTNLPLATAIEAVVVTDYSGATMMLVDREGKSSSTSTAAREIDRLEANKRAVESCTNCLSAGDACDFGRGCAECASEEGIWMQATSLEPPPVPLACAACTQRGFTTVLSLARPCASCLAANVVCTRFAVITFVCDFDLWTPATRQQARVRCPSTLYFNDVAHAAKNIKGSAMNHYIVQGGSVFNVPTFFSAMHARRRAVGQSCDGLPNLKSISPTGDRMSIALLHQVISPRVQHELMFGVEEGCLCTQVLPQPRFYRDAPPSGVAGEVARQLHIAAARFVLYTVDNAVFVVDEESVDGVSTCRVFAYRFDFFVGAAKLLLNVKGKPTSASIMHGLARNRRHLIVCVENRDGRVAQSTMYSCPLPSTVGGEASRKKEAKTVDFRDFSSNPLCLVDAPACVATDDANGLVLYAKRVYRVMVTGNEKLTVARVDEGTERRTLVGLRSTLDGRAIALGESGDCYVVFRDPANASRLQLELVDWPRPVEGVDVVCAVPVGASVLRLLSTGVLECSDGEVSTDAAAAVRASANNAAVAERSNGRIVDVAVVGTSVLLVDGRGVVQLSTTLRGLAVYVESIRCLFDAFALMDDIDGDSCSRISVTESLTKLNAALQYFRELADERRRVTGRQAASVNGSCGSVSPQAIETIESAARAIAKVRALVDACGDQVLHFARTRMLYLSEIVCEYLFGTVQSSIPRNVGVASLALWDDRVALVDRMATSRMRKIVDASLGETSLGFGGANYHVAASTSFTRHQQRRELSGVAAASSELEQAVAKRAVGRVRGPRSRFLAEAGYSHHSLLRTPVALHVNPNAAAHAENAYVNYAGR